LARLTSCAYAASFHELVDDLFWKMVHGHKVTGIAFKRLDGSLDVARTEFSPREEECEEDDEID